MRRHTLLALSAVLLAVPMLLVACGGSGATVERTRVRENLGRVTQRNIIAISEQTLLTTYGYRYQRQETQSPDNIYLETEWKDLRPTDDEVGLGIQFVRARFIINARTSNRSTGDLTARLEAEAQYRMRENPNWVDAPMTAEREAYFDDVIDYLERELRSAWLR